MPLLYLDKSVVKEIRKMNEYLPIIKTILLLIPPGKVTTYGSIAKMLGITPRMVGKLLSLNDEAPIIPCHRVVGKDGSLVGYSGVGGLEFKKKLLMAEGVKFVSNYKVDKSCIIDISEILGSP